jgi:hypothetical protein
VTILWLYAFALLGAAVLGGVMHWLWGDHHARCTTGAEAERFVREIASREASEDPTFVHSRARELVVKWDAVQGGMSAA